MRAEQNMVQPDNLMSMHQPQTHTQKKNKKKKPTIFHILISLSSIIWILNMTQVISPAFHHPTPKYRLGRNIFSLLKASTSTLNRRSLPRPHNQLIGNSVLPLSWLAGWLLTLTNVSLYVWCLCGFPSIHQAGFHLQIRQVKLLDYTII